MKQKRNLGFTLIELLVVIAIIGLLASVVLLALNSARQKSRDAKRLADIHQLSNAMELYYNELTNYPTQATTATTIPGLSPTYLGQLPVAPLPADSATCAAATTGGINNDYLYTSADGKTYTITFCLGDTTGSYGPGVHTLSESGIQ